MDTDPAPRVPPWASRTGKALNRIARSGLARGLVTLAILAVAALTIRGELKSARLADIAQAMAGVPAWAIAASAGFTVLTYACGGVLEWRVLRFVGKPLGLIPTLAAASAASALSIAMGFGLASGTAARLRFYAFAHLSAADAAKVTALVSGALVLAGFVAVGLSAFGGLPMVAHMLRWPSWGVVALSLGLLAIAPGWFWALHRWRGQDPLDATARAMTLGAGLGDWIFQGAAMFVLAGHAVQDFPGVLAVFCLGSLLGSLLGVPADLGVLEAAVLGSHALGPPHQGAAALVLFRVIFQLVPLVLATGALVLRPALKAARKIGG